MNKWFISFVKEDFSKITLGAIIGGVITLFFTVPQQWLTNFISQKENKIHYEIMSTNKLSKTELKKILADNFNTLQCDFRMDDEIISEYYHTTLKILNKGDFIEGSTVFNLDFYDEKVKILDLLCKMTVPEIREIDAEVDRPPLELSLFKEAQETVDVNFSWTLDEEQVGSIWYKSYIENGGFGRKYPLPITGQNFIETIPVRLPCYFMGTHLGYSGMEGEPSNILKWPDLYFNHSSFQDTIDFCNDMPCSNLDQNVLLSRLNEFKQNENKNKKIFIRLNKNKFRDMVFPQSYSDLPIFFQDDVPFLYGRTTFILNGVPKKAEIILHIIYKTYGILDEEKLKISLRDSKNITLIRKSTKKSNVKLEDARPLNNDTKQKRLLTPYQARIFLEKEKIIVAWAIPKDDNYQGVRIFKSVINNLNDVENDLIWGKEIYEGKGSDGVILGTSFGIFRPIDNEKLRVVYPDFTPPKRKSEETIPGIGMPTNIRITGVDYNDVLNGIGGSLMPFFVDDSIICNEIYLYTIIAFDHKNNYSYPIRNYIINPCNVEYAGEAQFLKRGVQPYVKSIFDYENDLDILHLLKKYYESKNNKNKAEEIMNIIDKKDTIEPTTK